MKKRLDPDQPKKIRPKTPKTPDRYEGNRWTPLILLIVTILVSLIFSALSR